MEKATFQDIEAEVETMIKRRLKRTQEWAEKEFEGEDDIDTMCYLARLETLAAIGEAYRVQRGILQDPLGTKHVNN